MPRLTRYFVKTSFVYLLLALIAGVLLGASPMIGSLGFPGLRVVYVHLLVVGWITLLIMGIAFWMLPKYSKEEPRRSFTLGWVSYGLMNAGLILRIIAEPFTGRSTLAGWLLIISAVLQMLGGWAFVVNSWGRVKER